MKPARNHAQLGDASDEVLVSGRRTLLKESPAFTQVELLVSISIVALMMTLLVPSLRKAREAGRPDRPGTAGRPLRPDDGFESIVTRRPGNRQRIRGRKTGRGRTGAENDLRLTSPGRLCMYLLSVTKCAKTI